MESLGFSETEVADLLTADQVEVIDNNGTLLPLDLAQSVNWSFPVKLKMWIENVTSEPDVAFHMPLLSLHICLLSMAAVRHV